MTIVLDIGVPVLAGLSLLAALYFFVNALLARGSVSSNTYGVERQKVRQHTLIGFARGGFFLLLSLILFSVFGINSIPEQVTEPALPTQVDTISPRETEPIVTISSPLVPTSRTTPTSPLPPPTVRPTDTPIPTDTPVILTAIVVSANGLWLRDSPGGTQELELIPDGATLIVLEGNETVDDSDWQEVETVTGNTGWVAVDFIVFD